MGTRAWGLESSVENRFPLRPCPPVSGVQGRSDAGRGQLKKIIKNFYHLFKNRRFPLFI